MSAGDSEFGQASLGSNPTGGSFRSQRGILSGSPKIAVIVLIVVACAAFVSSVVAIREALVGGIDFQWSGAHLLGLHQDPWKTFIEGDPKRQIILAQQPNYLAELYLVLLPLGGMAFSKAVVVWCFINLALLAATLWMVSRMYGLDRTHAIALALLTLASTPFRVTMANGQQSVFILFMLTLVFYARNRIVKSLALGLSYAKYSFSPVLVLLLLFKKRFDVVLLSMIPPLIGLFAAWILLGGKIKLLAVEPMETAARAVGPGNADIMSPIEIGLRSAGASPGLVSLIPAIAGLLAAVVAAFLIARSKHLDDNAQFALVIILTLFCFKHLIYDFIVLLVPVAGALMARRSFPRMVALLCMVYFWFGSSILNRVTHGQHAPKILLNCAVLIIMALATARLSRESDPQFAAAT